MNPSPTANQIHLWLLKVEFNEMLCALLQCHLFITNYKTPFSSRNYFVPRDVVGRIHDHRMIKFRLKDKDKDKNSIETSHYSVADREALLGFPVGYVELKGESFLIPAIHNPSLA